MYAQNQYSGVATANSVNANNETWESYDQISHIKAYTNMQKYLLKVSFRTITIIENKRERQIWKNEFGDE